MKFDHFTRFICWLSLLFLGACGTPSRNTSAPPALAGKLDPTWIASAKRLQSGQRTIYYRGRANTDAGSSARHWSGTIEGEVLVLNRDMAVVVPSGKFTLRSNGAVATSGPHTVITERSESWKHLLVP